MSKKNNSPSLFSENISGFLNFVNQAVKDYDWNTEQLEKLNKLTQDYLHKLELEDLSYKEKAKIGIQLSKIRKQRRLHKDSIELLTPLINYLNTEKGKQQKNSLNEVLGQIRRNENRLGDKKYYFRVLEEPPIESK